ncbi:MAG: hypothetical protein CPDRYDRY_7022 [uncultured Paraburkholderia sp.]|nr:MAG: hypothetical protein CPDRYDRY_7022 [uncultured Paraburkholderia sp.]
MVGYVLGKKTGLLLAFTVTLVPGLLSVCSAWPAITLRPDTYEDGTTGRRTDHECP